MLCGGVFWLRGEDRISEPDLIDPLGLNRHIMAIHVLSKLLFYKPLAGFQLLQ
jgi:hypothetical protein